jgi:hypothetical protein
LPRRSQSDNDSEVIRAALVNLLTNFAGELQTADLRDKVRALIPAFHQLRDLGSSLLPRSGRTGARDRIAGYFSRYPLQIIDGEELMVVSGISEWARRVRELRVQFGWAIYSGVTFHQIIGDAVAAAVRAK